VLRNTALARQSVTLARAPIRDVAYLYGVIFYLVVRWPYDAYRPLIF
jgi:hypothetical protein